MYNKREFEEDEDSGTPFEWNSKETLDLVDLLQSEKGKDYGSKATGIVSPYIKTLEQIYLDFYSRHKRNNLPIDVDIRNHQLELENKKNKKKQNMQLYASILILIM